MLSVFSFCDEYVKVHDGDIDIKYCRLMQCTGLKDKNGKLIYDGDVVRIQMRTNGELKYYTFTIKWDSGTASFQTLLTSDNEIYPVMRLLDSSEIIGNIHQNPELLK